MLALVAQLQGSTRVHHCEDDQQLKGKQNVEIRLVRMNDQDKV